MLPSRDIDTRQRSEIRFRRVEACPSDILEPGQQTERRFRRAGAATDTVDETPSDRSTSAS